jgi:hypothetical protein
MDFSGSAGPAFSLAAIIRGDFGIGLGLLLPRTTTKAPAQEAEGRCGSSS